MRTDILFSRKNKNKFAIYINVKFKLLKIKGIKMGGNIDKVINFWFGRINDQLSPVEKSKLWYHATSEDDENIRRQFEHLYEQAFHGLLTNWLESAKGTMALIILLDQMPRNMYRGSDRAFLSDHLALDYCMKGLSKGYDKQLQLVERAFFYHPLEHAENLKMQQVCVIEFQRLQQVYQGDAQQEFIRGSLNYAKQHREIIEKFGRFPYRNKLLGRESTEEEIVFLKQGLNFGQASS